MCLNQASNPHHVGEVWPCEEFCVLLVGGNVGQQFQAEELWDGDDVSVQQTQLLLEEGAVQVDTLLQNREEKRVHRTVNKCQEGAVRLHTNPEKALEKLLFGSNLVSQESHSSISF